MELRWPRKIGDKMSFKLQKEYRSVTPAGGSVSYNTSAVHGRLTGVRVKPTSAGTQWHLKVTDAKGFAIYESDTLETGELNDIGVAGMLGQVQGVLTVAITNETASEAMDIQLDIEAYQLVK